MQQRNCWQGVQGCNTASPHGLAQRRAIAGGLPALRLLAAQAQHAAVAHGIPGGGAAQGAAAAGGAAGQDVAAGGAGAGVVNVAGRARRDAKLAGAAALGARLARHAVSAAAAGQQL